MKHKISAFAVSLLMIATIMPGLAKAQQNSTTNASGGNGFRISPVRVELTVDKGKSDSATITIQNPTSATVKATLVANDFVASDDESGQPRIIFDPSQSAPSNSFKSLVSGLGNIDLAPNAETNVKVTINVPANASAGGYYGAIRVVPQNEADKNVSLSASVGTIFLITVPGNLTEKLELVEFTAAKNGSTGRFFINAGKMSIVTRLKNTGNIHVKPFGHVSITDRSGKVVESYEFNNTDPRSNILPNTIRRFDDPLKNTKWIGKYSVVANLGYGTGGNLITARNTFWVIPMWVIIAAAVLILGFIVAGYLVYRRLTIKTKHQARPRR